MFILGHFSKSSRLVTKEEEVALQDSWILLKVEFKRWLIQFVKFMMRFIN